MEKGERESVNIRPAEFPDIDSLVGIIRRSHGDVAQMYGITPDNNPRHPSFCKPEWIESALEKNVRFYLMELDGIAVGCVALEEARPGVAYLERLSVLPEYRKRGFGKMLVAHIFDEARKIGVRQVEIGIIAEYEWLKNWYRKRGFVEKKTKVFEHLPFRVLFMYAPV
jgi:GNAT superfamily N-acetyltransferase